MHLSFGFGTVFDVVRKSWTCSIDREMSVSNSTLRRKY